MKNKKLNVFVAAGSATPKDNSFLTQGKILGEFLGRNGYTMVQGGSPLGFMGAAYNEFIKYSDSVILHTWDIFKDCQIPVGNLVVHNSLNTRLENFLRDSDVLVVLPGANGTLHEFSTFFEYTRYFSDRRNIILVNYKGYYNSFIDFIKHQIETGFLKESDFIDNVVVVSDANEATQVLGKMK